MIARALTATLAILGCCSAPAWSSWTEAVASGGPTSGVICATRDASRDHLYLATDGAVAIYKWDGATMLSPYVPTGGGANAFLCVDVDATDDVIYLSGAKATSPNDGIRYRAPLPLDASPGWAYDLADNNKFSGNMIRFSYGGSTYVDAYLGTPGAATGSLQRRSTWNGAQTVIGNVHTSSADSGERGFLVKLSDSVALAVYRQSAGTGVRLASLTNDPSDAFAATTRSSVTSGAMTLYQPYPSIDGAHLVWSAGDGTNSRVESTTSALGNARQQTLTGAGAFIVGPAIDGTQYGIDGLTLYSRTSDTADFVDASDPVPGTTEEVIAVTWSHDGTQLMAWRDDGKAYTLDLSSGGGGAPLWLDPTVCAHLGSHCPLEVTLH